MLPLVLMLALGLAIAGTQANAERPRLAGRYVTTSDGAKLHVTVKGTGTPCLYIHGGPGSGSYWLEEFSGPMLERSFRMVYLGSGERRAGLGADQPLRWARSAFRLTPTDRLGWVAVSR